MGEVTNNSILNHGRRSMKDVISAILLVAVLLMACNGVVTPDLPVATSSPTQPQALPNSIPTRKNTPISHPVRIYTPTPTALLASPPTVNRKPSTGWQDVEIALCRSFFGPGYITGHGLCEWEFLGQSENEIYVNALCRNTSDSMGTTMRSPAVIFLGADGTIEKVSRPEVANYSADLHRLFPSEVIENLIAPDQAGWGEHITARLTQTALPPLIAETDR
jgi:hypothetical protein